MSWINKRMTEPSTWAGVGLVITQAATAVATKDPGAIAATLMGLLAIIKGEKAV